LSRPQTTAPTASMATPEPGSRKESPTASFGLRSPTSTCIPPWLRFRLTPRIVRASAMQVTCARIGTRAYLRRFSNKPPRLKRRSCSIFRTSHRAETSTSFSRHVVASHLLAAGADGAKGRNYCRGRDSCRPHDRSRGRRNRGGARRPSSLAPTIPAICHVFLTKIESRPKIFHCGNLRRSYLPLRFEVGFQRN
jgi:hypothetical protein